MIVGKENKPQASPSPTGSSGVSSLNSLTGPLDILAGSGISVTPSGSGITIAVIGGGGTIGGSINTNQIGYGTGANTLGSDSAFLRNVSDDRYSFAGTTVSTNGLFYNGAAAPNGLGAFSGFGMDFFGVRQYKMGSVGYNNNTNLFIDDMNQLTYVYSLSTSIRNPTTNNVVFTADSGAKVVQFGDLSGSFNSTSAVLDDTISNFTYTGNTFTVKAFGGAGTWISSDASARVVEIGDTSVTNNGTKLKVDDSGAIITAVTNGNFIIENKLGTWSCFFTDDTSHQITLGDHFLTNKKTIFSVKDLDQTVFSTGRHLTVDPIDSSNVFGLNDFSRGGTFSGNSDVTYTVTIDGVNQTVFVVGLAGPLPGAGTTLTNTSQAGSATVLGALHIFGVVWGIAVTITGGSWADNDTFTYPGGSGSLSPSSSVITADTITLTNDFGTASNIPIVFSISTTHSITVFFGAAVGHTLGDEWSFSYHFFIQQAFLLDYANNVFKIGDINASAGNTFISVDDANFLINLHGKIAFKRNSNSGTFDIDSLEAYYIDIDTSGGSSTPTLPLANSVEIGRTYVITDYLGNASSNSIIVTCSGGDTIEGIGTLTLSTDYQSVTVHSDGISKWIPT